MYNFGCLPPLDSLNDKQVLLSILTYLQLKIRLSLLDNTMHLTEEEDELVDLLLHERERLNAS